MKLIIFEDQYGVRAYNADKFIGLSVESCLLDDGSLGNLLTIRFENDWNIRLNPDTNCMENEWENGEEYIYIEAELPDEMKDEVIPDSETFRNNITEGVKQAFFEFLTDIKDGVFDFKQEIINQEEALTSF